MIHVRLVSALVVAATTLITSHMLSLALASFNAGAQPKPLVSLGIAGSESLAQLADEKLPPLDAPVPPAAGRPEAASPAERRARAEQAWAIGLRSLEAEPLSSRNLRILGEAADARGDQALTASLMELSARQSFREVRATAWLVDRSVARHDYPSALRWIDALIRTFSSGWTATFPALVRMAADPTASVDLASALARQPPWRASFFANAPDAVRQAMDLDAFYLSVMTGPEHLSNSELKPYLSALIKQRAVGAAYYLWLLTFPEESWSEIGLLPNGDFEAAPTNLPFDWQIDPIAGAIVQIAPVPGSPSGHGLQVEFPRQRVKFRNVSKVLMLPPGRFKLAGKVWATALANARGMTWSVSCLDGDKPIGETERVSGTTEGWNAFATQVDVPDAGCQAQILRLELAAHVETEQEVSGAIRYDDLAIERLELKPTRAALPDTTARPTSPAPSPGPAQRVPGPRRS